MIKSREVQNSGNMDKMKNTNKMKIEGSWQKENVKLKRDGELYFKDLSNTSMLMI